MPALKQFATKFGPDAKRKIASAVHPLKTSVLESMNNKNKLIRRMAYAYRDKFYLFMKFKGVFPGKT